MKVLTLTQPYATLVAIGAKRIETRSWSTNYRGPLAIHAAAGLGPVGGKQGLADLCATEPFRSVLDPLWSPPGTFFAPRCLLFGAIVAVCRLVACEFIAYDWPIGQSLCYTGQSGRRFPYGALTDQERAFGDYSPGRYAWLLADIRALPTPIPAKGALGLWECEVSL